MVPRGTLITTSAPFLPWRFCALAVAAGLSYKFSLISEGKKSVHTLVGNKNDVTAVAAVTPVGAALGNVLFSPEGYGAVSSGACLHEDLYLIYKHQLVSPFSVSVRRPRYNG